MRRAVVGRRAACLPCIPSDDQLSSSVVWSDLTLKNSKPNPNSKLRTVLEVPKKKIFTTDSQAVVNKCVADHSRRVPWPARGPRERFIFRPKNESVQDSKRRKMCFRTSILRSGCCWLKNVVPGTACSSQVPELEPNRPSEKTRRQLGQGSLRSPPDAMDLSTLLTKPPFAVAVYALLPCEDKQRAFAAQELNALFLPLSLRIPNQADPPGIGRARLRSQQMSNTCRLPGNVTLKIRSDMG